MYAAAGAKLAVGDECVVGRHAGEVAFVGDGVEGLPGGVWVGIRYVEAVGKNDGSVKGVRLFSCLPDHGHVVRPDKVSVVRHKDGRPVESPAPPSGAAWPHQAGTPTKGFGGSSGSAFKGGRVTPRGRGSPARPGSAGSRPRTPATTDSPTPYYNPDKLAHGAPEEVIGSDERLEDTMPRNRVGMVYDERMGEHRATCGYHPEQPARIKAIFCRLEQHGLAQRCVRVPARAATEAELQCVHTEKHIAGVIKTRGMEQGELDTLAAQLDSVYLCPESAQAALLAAGSVIEATKRVSKGVIKSAVCVVRPPGHHAEPDRAMGFCLFGNVAVAAREARRQGWAKRVLIVDWDAHHGNGTQKMFEDDPTVLFVSIHRYDRGEFYPGGPDGDYTSAGQGEGLGYSINIPWPKSGAGDAEYVRAFESVVMPAALHFKPELVLVSAGFDSAAGDPLGGCRVSPECFNWMTHQLTQLAGGRMVIALEGGYNLRSISTSLSACVSALLGDPLMPMDNEREGAEVHLKVIDLVRDYHSQYWPCFPKAEEQAPPSSPGKTSLSVMHESPTISVEGNAGSHASDSSPKDISLSPGGHASVGRSSTGSDVCKMVADLSVRDGQRSFDAK